MTRVRSLLSWLAIIGMIVAHSLTAHAQSPVASPESSPAALPFEPTFEESSCAYQLTMGLDNDDRIVCGWVTAPMYYDRVSNESVKLPVMILKSTTDTNDGTPLVLLNGGPGQGMDGVLIMFSDIMPIASFLREGQDVILFDQRGMGLSEPSLRCPFEPYPMTAANATPIVDPAVLRETPQASPVTLSDATLNQQLIDCKGALESQGIDLTAFTTRNNAADVNALRIAMGYDQIDLYGISYGSKLALNVMRDYPEGIHSAMLASTLPLEADPYVDQLIGFDRALRSIMDQCAANTTCNSTRPKLEETYLKLVEDLDANPVSVPSFDLMTGREVAYQLDGSLFTEAIYMSIFTGVMASSVPDLIIDTANGNYDLLSTILPMLAGNAGASMGSLITFNCADEAVYTSQEKIQEEISGLDLLPPIANMEFSSLAGMVLPICDQWNLPQGDPHGNEPFTSDIPTLILSGTLDPITPSENAQMVDENFSHATVVEITAAAHDPGSLSGPCVWGIMQSFLKDPNQTYDVSCALTPVDFDTALSGIFDELDGTPTASPVATPMP